MAGQAAPAMVKCRGLYTTSNRYSLPEGALLQATNILILRDGVIQPRWALQPSSTSMTSGNVSAWHRAAQLNGTLWYGGRDTSANTLKIGYASTTFAGVTGVSFEGSTSFDGPDLYSTFTGSSTPYYDMEFLNVGNLLYANTWHGLVRIESPSVQHRAGSYPCSVSCFPRLISVTDLSRSGSSTATATTAFAHGYVAGLKVTISGSSNTGFFANGEFTIVTTPSSTTFTYVDATDTGTRSGVTAKVAASNLVGSSGFMAANDQVEYRALIVEYDSNGAQYVGEVSAPTVVENNAPFVGTAAGKNVQLAVLFSPASLSSNAKIELYRSRTNNAAAPNDECFLVSSRFLSALDISRGYVWFVDFNPDSSSGYAQALYTNGAQDTLAQNNNRPAACKTVALWKDRLVQANTFDFPTINMKLLSTDASSGGIAVGDSFQFDLYTWFKRTLNNVTMVSVASGTAYTDVWQYTVFTGGTVTTDVRHTVLSLIDSLNWTSVDFDINPCRDFVAKYTTIGTDWPGSFAIVATTPIALGNFNVASPTLNAYAAVYGPGTSVRGAFAPKLGATATSSGAGVTRASNVVTLTTSANHNLEVGEYVIVYDSLFTQTTIGGTAVEGQISAVTANTITLTNNGSNGTAAGAKSVIPKFFPRLETNPQKNNLRVSKPGSLALPTQQEAFPPANTIRVGQPNAQILKCVPCKDSLMVFKEDGLFRVTASGAYGEVLSAELVDPNAILWAKDSAVAINGVIMAWLTKGVAIINEQGVQKFVSAQRIDDRLAPATTSLSTPDLLAYPYSRRAQAFVDEKNNLYELRVNLASGPSAPYSSTVNLIYNTHNDTWVEDNLSVTSEVFYQGKRYIAQGSTFYAQTDVQTTTATTITALSAASSGSVTGTYTGTDPAVGTLLVGATSKTYILSASSGSFTGYNPDANGHTDFLGAGFTIYVPVVCTARYAPITMGEYNKLKLFKQGHVLFGVRENMVSELTMNSDLVSSTETQICKLGAPPNLAGVNGFSPYNLRFLVPQQHRVGQQLNLQIVTRSTTAWTIEGIGLEADIIGIRLNR